ncbi:hypothetical protein BUALT_Bualt16G0086500 [Buddleja alternifolia]|uniref:BHLH domain-containing protein n=1 Tax=Buddleja alternifolia TaxID=168488 RepID=A0AAV6WBP0_9LAMI|nr:hypothetical protein BUALT_Bualt16G0086500 [Buddleja alternifolia]
MRQPNSNRDREMAAMNNINSLRTLPLQEIQNHDQSQMLSSSQHFDPTSSQHDDFLEQMLSSVPPSAASFPWSDDQTAAAGVMEHLEEQSAAALSSRMRHHQISGGAAKALMLQHQLLRGLAAVQDDVVDAPSFDSANLANNESVKALFNGYAGSLGQTSNESQHFHHLQGGALQHNQKFGAPAASGSSGGGAAAQPRQRVRARRGQATDPHSIAERLRRERIAERMKGLQELVPNANKTDKASMLDEIIDYVKFLQLQVKVLSMSRLGGAGAVAPLVADKSCQGKNNNGAQTASSSNNDGMTVTENQVVKMMEEDMGSAMQYLQAKGLCLMPISLATAISTATSHSRNPLTPSNNINGNAPLLNGGEAGGPSSPSLSALTVQSATMGGSGANSASQLD